MILSKRERLINKAKYYSETYTNKAKKLRQTFVIHYNQKKVQEDMELCFYRNTIKDNLPILISQKYYDKNMNLILEERLVRDGWMTINRHGKILEWW